MLITGGAGFIGYHLAKKLSEQGNTVTILDNFARGKKDKHITALIDSENVELLTVDMTVKEQVLAIPHDFDIVYHFAAINGTENFYRIPDKVLNVGVLSILFLLEWYSIDPKARLIVGSSSETYAGVLKVLKDKFPIPTPENVPLIVDDPSNVRWSYGGSKIISEIATYAYAKARNFDNFTIVRFHNIYGPRMGTKHVIPQFIKRIVNKVEPFPIFGGNETRTFCFISDGIAALKLIAESEKAKGKIIHVGRDDDEISITDLAKILMKVAGVNPDFEVKPAPEGSVQRRCPDISKLKAFGYTPKISLEQGLKETYGWYKEFFAGEYDEMSNL